MVNDKYIQKLKERQLEEHSDHLLTEELFSNSNNNNKNNTNMNIIFINERENNPKGIKDNAKIKQIILQPKPTPKTKDVYKTIPYGDDDIYYDLEQKLLNKTK